MGRADWSKEMLQKYDRVGSKYVYDIVIGDDPRFTRMSPKVNGNRLNGCFKMSQIQ